MHTIEEIIADAQSAVAASLRQAYDAGRHHQTTEMREKFVAFFDGVFAPLSGAPAAEAAARRAAPRDAAGRSDGRSRGRRRAGGSARRGRDAGRNSAGSDRRTGLRRLTAHARRRLPIRNH